MHSDEKWDCCGWLLLPDKKQQSESDREAEKSNKNCACYFEKTTTMSSKRV